MEIRRQVSKKGKQKEEVVVTFETKEISDAIKACASNLANYRDEAGMRLHVPDHLQKMFKLLMSLLYELKQTNSDLKRNVKFNEDNLSIFMDIQTKKGGP